MQTRAIRNHHNHSHYDDNCDSHDNDAICHHQSGEQHGPDARHYIFYAGSRPDDRHLPASYHHIQYSHGYNFNDFCHHQHSTNHHDYHPCDTLPA